MIREIKQIEETYGEQLSPRARFQYVCEVLENPLEHDPRDLAEEAGISKSSAYEYVKEDEAARKVLE